MKCTDPTHSDNITDTILILSALKPRGGVRCRRRSRTYMGRTVTKAGGAETVIMAPEAT